MSNLKTASQRAVLQLALNHSTVQPTVAPRRAGIALAPPASGIAFVDQAGAVPLQRKSFQAPEQAAMLATPIHGRPQRLPGALRAGIEQLSGLDMAGVRVHLNSPLPAQINALAFTQGSDIHVSPGQQAHLPHEAWHVVQQAQGRVRPTLQTKSRLAVNDDAALEQEADRMGAQAMALKASNSAASAALRPASPRTEVAQAKNLKQAGLAASFSDDGKRDLVSDKREVNLYVKKDDTKAANKVDAIKKAAALNAQVGVAVDGYAENTLRIRKKNDKWTGKAEALDSDGLNKVDPFMFGVMVPFGDAEHDEQIELIFQHAVQWTGYVEAIYDSTNVNTRSVPTMFDVGEDPSIRGSSGTIGEHYRNLKFSNVHEKHPATSAAPKILDLTSGGGERNLDAYTKLAGEGARWQCVRNQSAHLSDDSLFYTAHASDPTKVQGIEFKTLWITWAETFNKDYDISDLTVRQKIAGDAVLRKIKGRATRVPPKVRNISALTSKDYNLDTSKTHGT